MSEERAKKKLNLGCGKTILDGWINLDRMSLPGVDILADLDNCGGTPLPFEANSIDEFLCSHVLEHLKNPLPFMQELHRIAKPNASLLIKVPYGSSDVAFEDPTHVRQFFCSSFGYFSQPFYWAADYGYRGDWKTERIDLVVEGGTYIGKRPQEIYAEIRRYRNIVLEMKATLRAVKPIREPEKEMQDVPEITIVLL